MFIVLLGHNVALNDFELYRKVGQDSRNQKRKPVPRRKEAKFLERRHFVVWLSYICKLLINLLFSMRFFFSITIKLFFYKVMRIGARKLVIQITWRELS